MKYCFAADIGGTAIKMGLFDEKCTLLEKWEIKTRTQNDGEAVLPDISCAVLQKAENFGIAREDVLGIGVGIPAPVTKEGVVNGSSNLGWKHKEVIKELEALTGFKVYTGNDANLAALGEMKTGAGRGVLNMVLVTLGTGIGGGVIANGQVLEGAGAAGEIGHICVNYEETKTCGCKRKGCMEQYSSATGISRLAKMKLKNETRDTLLYKGGVTAKDVFDAVKAGDEVACEVAEEFADYLGKGLADIAAILDPSLIVIGGGVSKAGEILLSFIEKGFERHAFFANRHVRFALASLGNEAGIYGCAALVLGKEGRAA